MRLVDYWTWVKSQGHSSLVYQSDISLDMRPGTSGPGEVPGAELSHRFSSTRRCLFLKLSWRGCVFINDMA